MTIVRTCLKASDIIALVQRIEAEDGFISEDAFYAGIARLELAGIEGIPADMLIKHIRKYKDSKGYVSQTKFREWLRELSRVQISDVTAFDLLDEKYQDPNWPTTGRWYEDDNPGAKHVTEIKTEDIAGLL